MNHNNLLKTANARKPITNLMGVGIGSLFSIAFACVVFFGATGGI